MGERKGQNHYYPPDFDPGKHKNLNAYHGTHALRERAKKIKQGILVIRFEMPYNIWCLGCNAHIGMGVRYNAEKSKVGMYYTTPIYKFHMKCHLCDQYFDIQTDPQHFDYVIVSGARRKEQRWDPAQNEQIVPEDKATGKKLMSDPMFKLEHGSDDRSKVAVVQPAISQLERLQERLRDDHGANRAARDVFRVCKRERQARTERDSALLSKASLPSHLELLPESGEDRRLAGLLTGYGSTTSISERERLEAVMERPLFPDQQPNAASPSTSSGGGGSGKDFEQIVAETSSGSGSGRDLKPIVAETSSGKESQLSRLAAASSRARVADRVLRLQPTSAHQLGVVRKPAGAAGLQPGTTGAVDLQPGTTGAADLQPGTTGAEDLQPGTTGSGHLQPGTTGSQSTAGGSGKCGPVGKLLVDYGSDSDASSTHSAS